MIGKVVNGTFEVTRRDYAPLLQPIEIKCSTSTDNDGRIWWVGENDDLGIRVATSSRRFPNWRWLAIRRLKSRVVDDLDFMLDRYIIQGRDKITDHLRGCVNVLRRITAPDLRKDDRHWGDASDG